MVQKLIRICQPVHLLLAALTYTLGAGIARYLGYPLNWADFGLGLLASLTLLGATLMLTEYFHLALAPMAENESPRQREMFRVTLLQVSFAALALTFVAFLSLLLTRTINLLAGFLYLLTLLDLLAYAIPPISLAENGFGELGIAVFLGTLLPAFAFLLQSTVIHHLLSFITFPLTLLALAFLLAWDFPAYAADQKYSRHTLLTRLTWQRAVPIHHLLILFSFLFFSCAQFFNIPWGLIWPVFIALPFAFIQVFWLQRIANGGRTLWNFLTALSLATFGMSAYLLTMTFWIK